MGMRLALRRAALSSCSLLRLFVREIYVPVITVADLWGEVNVMRCGWRIKKLLTLVG
jgi:hypothetical protein